MAVVTFTSDLGAHSHLVAMLKGTLLGLDQNIAVVDISHDLEPFNLVQAAFILRNTWKHFPPGTIHIAGIETATAEHKRHLLAVHQGQYFITADNGLLSMVCDDEDTAWYAIDERFYAPSLFEARDIYVPVAVSLLQNGLNPESVAQPITDAKVLALQKPIVSEGAMIGIVLFNDRYQNAYSNVNKQEFEQYVNGRNFVLRLGRHERITRVSKHYSDVPTGEKLCLFGDNDLLQICINKGEAAKLLGLRPNSKFLIEIV